MADGYEDSGEPRIEYGDLRVTSDRRKGVCLFWVRARPMLPMRSSRTSVVPWRLAQTVPDISPGFNVPDFYEDFVQARRYSNATPHAIP